jgi:hypothetical protein
MRLLCLALLLVVPTVSWATEISIGGVLLDIPNPNGYTPVTQQMTLMFDLQKQFVSPTNELLLAYVPERDVSALLSDNIPDMPRRFTLETAKSLIGVTVPYSEFLKLKSTIISQNNQIIKKVEAEIDNSIKQLNKSIEQKYDVVLALSIANMVPMPIHYESDRQISFSMMVKYDFKDNRSNPSSFISVVTAAVIYVKGKVLFLYTYAQDIDLEWSRAASRQWADSIVDYNHSDLHDVLKEASPTSGIDWEQFGVRAVAWGIFGLITAFVVWVARRNRAR